MKIDSKGSVQKRKLRKGSKGYQREKRGDKKGEEMEPNGELRARKFGYRGYK